MRQRSERAGNVTTLTGVRDVPLGQLVCDPKYQTRASIDGAAISEYAESLAAGVKLPPVVAYALEGRLVVTDGWHRVEGAKRAKLTHLPTDVREGTPLDALTHALGANTDHGVRRTVRDKRRAVRRALREPALAEQSDRQLATLTGTTHPFVGAMRREIEQESRRLVSANVPQHSEVLLVDHGKGKGIFGSIDRGAWVETWHLRQDDDGVLLEVDVQPKPLDEDGSALDG